VKWEKFTTDEDRANGSNICPICRGDLEILVDEDEVIHKARCENGCYVYNLDLIPGKGKVRWEMEKK